MALALPRIRKQDLTFALTGGGTIGAIRDLVINTTQGTFDASAADATYVKKVLGLKDSNGTYSLFLGTQGIAPAVGDSITVISASVSTDEVTPATIDDSTVWGAHKVTSVSHDFSGDLAIANVSFEGGF